MNITISQTTLDSILGRLSDLERQTLDNTTDIKYLKLDTVELRDDLTFLEREAGAL